MLYILLTHTPFLSKIDRGLKAQGFDRTKNVYFSTLQPWLGIWGVFWTTLFILINGFAVFFSFNASDFLVAYINIPIFFGLYIVWKVIKRSKFWKPHEMDFVTVRETFYNFPFSDFVTKLFLFLSLQGIPTLEETEIPEVPPVTIPEKIAAVLF